MEACPEISNKISRVFYKRTLYLPLAFTFSRIIKPLNLTQREVAKGLGIPETKVSELIHGKLRINAEYALRLSIFFNMSERFWLNLQYDYDRRLLELSKAAEIKKSVRPFRKLTVSMA